MRTTGRHDDEDDKSTNRHGDDDGGGGGIFARGIKKIRMQPQPFIFLHPLNWLLQSVERVVQVHHWRVIR